jgi:cell division septation protein DedD
MTHQTRRLYPRKTLNPLPYVSLPSDNGGIVLDVSEQGLRFRAVAPVKQLGPIHFSFSAYSYRIDGVADLVWTDRAKKTGGLRFTQLSDEAREQIRKWPHELDLRLSVGKNFMLQIPASDDSSTDGIHRHGIFDAALQLATTWATHFRSTMREWLHPTPRNGAAESDAYRSKSHFQWKNRGLIYALSVIIVILTISMRLSYLHHRKTGESPLGLGPSIVGEAQPQTNRQTAASTPFTRAPGAGEASADESKLGGTHERVTPKAANAANSSISNSSSSGLPAPHDPAPNVRVSTRVIPRGNLVVQVAALTKENDARNLAESLRHENFEAFVGILPVDKLYRVMIGPYSDEASARIAAAKLKKAGLESFVRRESGDVLAGSSETKTP